MLQKPSQSEVERFVFQTEMSGKFLLHNFTLYKSNIFAFTFFAYTFVLFAALRISPSFLIFQIVLWSRRRIWGFPTFCLCGLSGFWILLAKFIQRGIKLAVICIEIVINGSQLLDLDHLSWPSDELGHLDILLPKISGQIYLTSKLTWTNLRKNYFVRKFSLFYLSIEIDEQWSCENESRGDKRESSLVPEVFLTRSLRLPRLKERKRLGPGI